MSLTFTPAASPSLGSEALRNPLGKVGMSRCIFDEAFTRKIGYLQDGRVAVSRGGRFVLGRKERSVGLWRVLGDEAGWEKVLEMDLRVSDRASEQEGQAGLQHGFSSCLELRAKESKLTSSSAQISFHQQSPMMVPTSPFPTYTKPNYSTSPLQPVNYRRQSE